MPLSQISKCASEMQVGALGGGAGAAAAAAVALMPFLPGCWAAANKSALPLYTHLCKHATGAAG